jgi:ATP-dependent Clp protease ATP-binding subunit ClpC
LLPVSERARQALLNAEAEARSLNHSYVGTEHVLLGLLREDDGAAARALSSLGVSYARVRTGVVAMMGVGVDASAAELLFTEPAQAAIDRAGREAAGLGADSVGTEHILLALTREPGGAAARILTQMDADPEAIRSALS